jgi:hypothetical protein
MQQAPVLPFRLRTRKRRAALRNAQPDLPGGLEAESVQSQVEVFAPDGYSTALLMEYVLPWFPAEVVSGNAWIVRLQTPDERAGEEWVFEVLALIERWLDAVPLEYARVRYCGRSYVIRASSVGAFAKDPRLAPVPAA